MTYLKTIAGGFVLGFALMHVLSALTDDTIYIDKEMYEDQDILALIYLDLSELSESEQTLVRKKVKATFINRQDYLFAERTPA